MSDELPPENSPHERDCEDESNGNSAKKTPPKPKDKGGISNLDRLKKESVIALCVGFILLSFVFSFFQWFEGILEKAHVSSPIIFCIIFIIFIVGISCVAWVVVEWLGFPKLTIGTCCFLSVCFLVFLCSHKSVYVTESAQNTPVNAADLNAVDLKVPQINIWICI
jgi:hypothetical protein